MHEPRSLCYRISPRRPDQEVAQYRNYVAECLAFQGCPDTDFPELLQHYSGTAANMWEGDYAALTTLRDKLEGGVIQLEESFATHEHFLSRFGFVQVLDEGKADGLSRRTQIWTREGEGLLLRLSSAEKEEGLISEGYLFCQLNFNPDGPEFHIPGVEFHPVFSRWNSLHDEEGEVMYWPDPEALQGCGYRVPFGRLFEFIAAAREHPGVRWVKHWSPRSQREILLTLSEIPLLLIVDEDASPGSEPISWAERRRLAAFQAGRRWAKLGNRFAPMFDASDASTFKEAYEVGKQAGLSGY